MAFGKRPLATAPQAAAATGALPLPPERPNEDRHIDLRDAMLRIIADTAHVADAIRDNGTVPISGVADDTDPVASPVPIRDLVDHFSFNAGGTLLHPFFAYATPGSPEQIDPSAQFQLLALVRLIRELNVFCQDAHHNEALAVALQSPKLPALVDCILVSAAFFAAYFDNIAVTHGFITGAASPGKALPDFARLQNTFDRHKLMASDRMLDPASLDAMLPAAPWPHLGVEIARRHEAGEQFVHGIYFPSTYARQLGKQADRAPIELRPV